MKLSYALLVVVFILFSSCAKMQTHEEAAPQQSTGQTTPTIPEIPSESAGFDLQKVSTTYRQRYGLTNPFVKLVNNHGDLYDNLYGVRNFRAVLHGVYYRGGANNLYNKNGVRSNSNPLPSEGLKNLCEEGFKNAIYLYSTNFAAAPKTATCKDFSNTPRTLDYLQISGLAKANEEKFIALIYKRIKGEIDGPIYGHCWNGWHASGFVATIALKQFCGYSDQKALDYWIANTDGNDADYATIKSKVKAWKPITKYAISAAESASICP